jgi:hypothetical protein
MNSRGVSGGLVETTCGEFDDGSHLVPVQPVKPFHDVDDVGSGFEILKNGYGTGLRIAKPAWAAASHKRRSQETNLRRAVRC